MKKKLLALLLAAALLLSLCPLALAEFYAEVYNTESLNIRSGPGSSYSWLGAVPLGERVRVVGESDNWYQVITLDNRLHEQELPARGGRLLQHRAHQRQQHALRRGV